MSNKRRIFIGIPLSESVKDGINHIKKGYPVLPAVKWTKKENLHITLVFIGEVSLEIADHLQMNLTSLNDQIPAFKLRFDAFKVIKRKRIPVMFWAVYQKNKAFEDLYNTLFKIAVASINIKKEHAEIIPHITIARIKQKEKSLPPLPSSVLPEIFVNSIVLWESILLPGGPEYKLLEEVKLK